MTFDIKSEVIDINTISGHNCAETSLEKLTNFGCTGRSTSTESIEHDATSIPCSLISQTGRTKDQGEV